MTLCYSKTQTLAHVFTANGGRGVEWGNSILREVVGIKRGEEMGRERREEKKGGEGEEND